MKAGVTKDPVYKDCYFRITPRTFLPPLEPFEMLDMQDPQANSRRLQLLPNKTAP